MGVTKKGVQRSVGFSKMREGVGCRWLSDLVVTLWFGIQPFGEPQYMKQEKAELFCFVYRGPYCCTEPSLKTGG